MPLLGQPPDHHWETCYAALLDATHKVHLVTKGWNSRDWVPPPDFAHRLREAIYHYLHVAVWYGRPITLSMSWKNVDLLAKNTAYMLNDLNGLLRERAKYVTGVPVQDLINEVRRRNFPAFFADD